MEILIGALYTISTALLYPVIAGLLILVAWVLLELGGFLHEAIARRRSAPHWQTFLSELQAAPNPPATSIVLRFFENVTYPGFLSQFADVGQRLSRSPIHMGRQISTLEIDAEGRLARMSFGIRVGPILGLMGTLIPLGPALIGLASGDVKQLANNLVVAFSTTVLGLFVGGVCYVISLVRRNWYAQDLADVEYLYQCLFPDEGVDHVVSESKIEASAVGSSATAGDIG